MPADTHFELIAASLLRARTGGQLRDLTISRSKIGGGLESKSVERIVASGRTQRGAAGPISFIAKRLEGHAVREAQLYRDVIGKIGSHLAPQLLFVETIEEGGIDLFLEDVRSIHPWPWREEAVTRAVLERLARLHRSSCRIVRHVPVWDYEQSLHAAAIRTIEQLQRICTHPEFSFARKGLRPLERFVSSLAAHRRELLSFDRFGNCLIHGDVHSGNVILTRVYGRDALLFIDWSRAREGSALEDVSSWLQSLGYWEPAARRRHDTLAKSYLSARGYEARLSTDFRAALWVASACNALAGALGYYCDTALSSDSLDARRHAASNAYHWLRAIVRADALTH